MTDNEKMREAFEKWYMTNTFAHVDHLSVFYNDLNCYPTPIANHCWKAWQAAKSSQLEAVQVPAQQYTTGHCANKAKPGGCQLHNLHCNYPICDRRPAAAQQPNKEGE